MARNPTTIAAVRSNCSQYSMWPASIRSTAQVVAEQRRQPGDGVVVDQLGPFGHDEQRRPSLEGGGQRAADLAPPGDDGRPVVAEAEPTVVALTRWSATSSTTAG